MAKLPQPLQVIITKRDLILLRGLLKHVLETRLTFLSMSDRTQDFLRPLLIHFWNLERSKMLNYGLSIIVIPIL